MIFIIPSQTLFQERTPTELMGRVIGIRFALVFGSMTIATGVAAVAGEILGPSIVLVVFGALILLWIFWHASVKNWFTGPKMTVGLPAGVSSSDEIGIEHHHHD